MNKGADVPWGYVLGLLAMAIAILVAIILFGGSMREGIIQWINKIMEIKIL